jgi:ABC-type iron transport system FetAB permease component
MGDPLVTLCGAVVGLLILSGVPPINCEISSKFEILFVMIIFGELMAYTEGITEGEYVDFSNALFPSLSSLTCLNVTE